MRRAERLIPMLFYVAVACVLTAVALPAAVSFLSPLFVKAGK